jgi:FkbM family methyltransferase
LDLGANVGLSVRLWQIKFPEVRVVAIEPSAASAKLLRKNVDEGPFPQSVIVVQAAVNSDGRPEFLDQSGDSDSHQVGTAGTPVAGISIDDAILQAAGADGMVDLVKMDIEGSERCLMACASRWVPKVRYLLVEIHGSYTERLLERDLSVACAQWKALHVRSAPGVATYFVILNPDDCPLHRIP